MKCLTGPLFSWTKVGHNKGMRKLEQETFRASLGFDSRFERLIGIIRLLALREHTTSELAEIFEVSVRTIERDIGLLERTGLHLVNQGRGRGYALQGRYSIPLRER